MPRCANPPLPLIAPESVFVLLPLAATVPLSVTAFANTPPFPWLTAKVAPDATETALLSEMRPVLPLPICKVPELTVVGPVKLLLPVKVSSPLPFCWNPRPPEMALDSVTESLRLNARVAPAHPLMEELAESDPVFPPAPICKVPAFTVVGPV